MSLNCYVSCHITYNHSRPASCVLPAAATDDDDDDVDVDVDDDGSGCGVEGGVISA